MTACILLAAGGSTRLGSPKQLIDVDGEPLVARSARLLTSLGIGPVGVVIGASAEAIRRTLVELDVAVIENATWSKGIGTSIRAGVAWAIATAATSVLIALCDQPDVDGRHLRRLGEIGESHDADVVASSYQGIRGVPAWFAQRTFDALLALPGEQGARSILHDVRFNVVTLPSDAAAVDLDTPADVARWQRARAGDSPRR